MAGHVPRDSGFSVQGMALVVRPASTSLHTRRSDYTGTSQPWLQSSASTSHTSAFVTVLSACAEMVKLGLAAKAPGITDPSTTNSPGRTDFDAAGLLASNT